MSLTNHYHPYFLTIIIAMGIIIGVGTAIHLKNITITHQSLPTPSTITNLNSNHSATFSADINPLTSSTSSALIPSQPPSEPLNFHLPILMYHYVEHVQDEGDTIRQSLNTSPETLTSQIKTLQQANYTFLTASQTAHIINGTIPLPEKAVLLTFDDAYEDFYTDVLPILKRYQIPATVYVITQFLDRPNYMTSQQLTAVRNSGLVEIGAHSQHHYDLPYISPTKATQEISGSKIDLEKKLAIPVYSFAYPSGRYNQEIITLTQDAGYTNAVSTDLGTEQTLNRLFNLYRLRTGGRSGPNLLKFLDQKLPLSTTTTATAATAAPTLSPPL